MSTFVLVHGGGHGGWCYSFVAEQLRQNGHRVICPTLTGVGERSHLFATGVNLSTHIQDIVNTLYYQDLTDVFLVGHSYGGMVITGVADQCPDRVANLVYLDAAYPLNNQSLADVAPDMMALAKASMQIIDDTEMVLFPGQFPMEPGNYYGVTNPELIDWMANKLTPHPWACFTEKLVFQDEARLRQIPVSFIATAIQKETLSEQEKTSLNALSQGRFFEINTGHDLMISEPEQTASVLNKITQM